MQKTENDVVIALLQMVNQKREEIKTLTCQVMALKDDMHNIVEITQLIQKILNNVYFASTPNAHLTETRALMIFQQLEANQTENDERSAAQIWLHHVAPELTRLCMEANRWNPIDVSVLAKNSKTIININLPKNINLASIIGKQSTE